MGPRFSREVITSSRMSPCLPKCTCRIPAMHPEVGSENTDTGPTQNYCSESRLLTLSPCRTGSLGEREELLRLVSSSVFSCLCLHYNWQHIGMGEMWPVIKGATLLPPLSNSSFSCMRHFMYQVRDYITSTHSHALY